MRATPAILVAGGLCLLASTARAQVNLGSELSPRKVEANERFVFRLRAMSDGGEQVSEPDLKLPPGVSKAAVSVTPQTSISWVNGQMSQASGISATWVLVASKPGKYKIGPASVRTSSGRTQDRALVVEVVAQGTLRQDPPPLGGQPLDPWSMLRGFGNSPFGFPGFPEPEEKPEEQLLPEEYRIDRPLDPVAFVRTRATPKKVMVGEQVTLSIYAYGGRGAFDLGLQTDPSHDDFLSFSAMEDRVPLLTFEQNDQRWVTRKVQQLALFPLKAGKLKAGAMSLGFVGRGYSNDPRGLSREAQAVEITVVEPPLVGRPPGYRVGDVGHYDLSATLEPREVPAGGSVAIVAVLKGTGNLPASLRVPEQNGVRFLDPQLVDQISPRSGVMQGKRTFTYVVELNQPGIVDLGELTLPYWDLESRAYSVARAVLGAVKVTGQAPVAKADPPQSAGRKLKGLVTPAPALAALVAAKRSYFTDRPSYFSWLLGLPLLTLMGFALSDLAKSLAHRVAARRGSLGAALDQALAQLGKATGSATEAASTAERALFLAIEKATGLKGRGVLKTELGRTLQDAGVTSELGERTAELLGQCDALRFAGEAVELDAFVEQVRQTCAKLAAHKARKPEPSSP